MIVELKAGTATFLGIQIDHNFSCTTNVEHVTCTLSSECFIMRIILTFLKTGILKLVWFVYYHFILSCGVIIWGYVQQKFCNLKYLTSKVFHKILFK